MRAIEHISITEGRWKSQFSKNWNVGFLPVMVDNYSGQIIISMQKHISNLFWNRNFTTFPDHTTFFHVYKLTCYKSKNCPQDAHHSQVSQPRCYLRNVQVSKHYTCEEQMFLVSVPFFTRNALIWEDGQFVIFVYESTQLIYIFFLDYNIIYI